MQKSHLFSLSFLALIRPGFSFQDLSNELMVETPFLIASGSLKDSQKALENRTQSCSSHSPHQRAGLPRSLSFIAWRFQSVVFRHLTFPFSSFKAHALSVQFSCSVVSDSLWPHEPQHTRPPCPSLTAGVYPNPCPLSWWCHPTISSSVIPSFSCLQSFSESESFPMSQFFASGGQTIGVSASASILPLNTQDWSPLGWTGWISLQSKGLSRVFSNTTVQKHQFFCTHLSL